MNAPSIATVTTCFGVTEARGRHHLLPRMAGPIAEAPTYRPLPRVPATPCIPSGPIPVYGSDGRAPTAGPTSGKEIDDGTTQHA